MVYTSVDLFSGIGGITRALEGIAKPVMYCEIDPKCTEVLRANMKRGALPTAPICGDVRALGRATVKGAVDLVAGGFPCVGFSSAGKREGLQEAQSALFYEMMRVVRQLKPSMVFMENVPEVLRSMGTIAKELSAAGFNCWWCVVPAYAAGAPQCRKRWFCLSVRRGVTPAPLAVVPRYTPFKWGAERGPRLVREGNLARCGMLGNAVVPDAVRLAFVHLFTGRWTLNPGTLAFTPPKTLPGATLPPGEAPRSGAALNGTIVATQDIPAIPPPAHNIVLDPKAFKGTATKPLSSPLITTRVVRNQWSTPRHGSTGPVNVLTQRGSGDLATMVRFAADTPNHLRGQRLNPDWVEWLMGFPKGYTSRFVETKHHPAPAAKQPKATKPTKTK